MENKRIEGRLKEILGHLTNSELYDALEMVKTEIRLSEKAIQEGFEEV